MSSYKELKEEFKKKVKKLQKQCDHQRGRWENGEVINGQQTIKKKICERCNLVLYKVVNCPICGKSFPVEEGVGVIFRLRDPHNFFPIGTTTEMIFCGKYCKMRWIAKREREGYKVKVEK